MSTKKPTLLSDTVWLSSERLINAILGFAATAIVARHLGPEMFGKLTYVTSVAALFAVIGHLGLDGLVVRELRTAEAPENRLLGTIFWLKFIAYCGAAIALGVYAVAVPSHDSDDIALFFMSSAFVVLSAFGFLNSWFLAKLEIRVMTVVNITTSLVQAGSRIAFVGLGLGVIWFGLPNLFMALLAATAFLALYWRRTQSFEWVRSFSGSEAVRLMREGSLVFVGAVMAIIYLKIDISMLRWLDSERAVGQYAVAAQLSEAAYILPTAIVTAYFPRLIDMRKKGADDFAKGMQSILDILWGLGLAACLVVFLAGEFVIHYMFGENYASSSTILMIHILAAPFVFMRLAFSRWVLIEKMFVFSLITQGIGAILNVILNFLMIPSYGGNGAALATVISYVAASYLSLALHPATQPVFWQMTSSILHPWRPVVTWIGARRAKHL